MINVNTFIQSVLAQANKEVIGFKPKPQDLNSFLADSLTEVYNYLLGRPQEYQQGRPVAIVASAKGRDVTEAERYLMTRETIAVTQNRIPVPDGQTVLNTDGQVVPAMRRMDKILCYYIAPGSSQADKREVKIIPSRDIQRRLDSEINKPTLKNPIAELDNTEYIIYPTANYVELVYLKEPQRPFWGFTVDNTLPANQRRPVYDPATSVDIEIPDHMTGLLKERMLYMMGVRERDPFMVQVSERREEGGRV